MRYSDLMSLLSFMTEKSRKQRMVYREGAASWQGISFLCGHYVLMTTLMHIVDISLHPKLTPIPGVQPWLKGVANIKGDVVPVSDLQYLLVQKETIMTPDSPVFLMKNKGELFGILVNQFLSLHSLTKHDNKKIEHSVFFPYVSEEITSDGQTFPLFDFTILLESDCFLNPCR